MSVPVFQRLDNFRDIAESVNNFSRQNLLRTGLFFRSATPDETTASDREKLIQKFAIRTIIDLRTTTEHINAAKKHSEAAVLIQPGVLPSPDKVVLEPLKIPGIQYVSINLNGKGFERALLWQLSYLNVAKVVGYMALGYRMEAVGIIARNVLQPKGLIGLGIDTLEHSGPEIKELFEVLSNQGSWPVLVHCTQGKDRTGITVLLVLLLCGGDMESITNDYVQSEIELDADKEKRRDEVKSIGLDESFRKCPKDFPQKIQEFIRERYGSVQDYLHHIGVDEDKLQHIRFILQNNGVQA